jgi:hypothetical protein
LPTRSPKVVPVPRALFASLIGTGSAWALSAGYILVAALMASAAIAEALLGVDAGASRSRASPAPLSRE